MRTVRVVAALLSPYGTAGWGVKTSAIEPNLRPVAPNLPAIASGGRRPCGSALGPGF